MIPPVNPLDDYSYTPPYTSPTISPLLPHYQYQYRNNRLPHPYKRIIPIHPKTLPQIWEKSLHPKTRYHAQHSRAPSSNEVLEKLKQRPGFGRKPGYGLAPGFCEGRGSRRQPLPMHRWLADVQHATPPELAKFSCMVWSVVWDGWGYSQIPRDHSPT